MSGVKKAIEEVEELPRLCAPLHRCFPPRPTLCTLCGEIDPTNCPLRPASTNNPPQENERD